MKTSTDSITLTHQVNLNSMEYIVINRICILLNAKYSTKYKFAL